MRSTPHVRPSRKASYRAAALHCCAPRRRSAASVMIIPTCRPASTSYSRRWRRRCGRSPRIPASRARSWSARSWRTSPRPLASTPRPRTMSTWSRRASSTPPRSCVPHCRTRPRSPACWSLPRPWSPRRRRSKRRCPRCQGAAAWAGWISKTVRIQRRQTEGRGASRALFIPSAKTDADQPERSRRNDKDERQDPRARDPAHAFARAHAHFVHDEFLAAAHLAVGFEEGGNPRHHLVVERGVLRAAARFALVQAFRLQLVALRILARLGVDLRLARGEVECAQQGYGVFSGV